MGGEIRKKTVAWDVAPDGSYFDELFRVSKNQIIWGGNYFSFPPTRCFLVWDKKIADNFTMASAEYAWTSFNDNAKIFRKQPSGQEMRFHPTQKPIELYEWIYNRFAKPGMKVIDTHLGSGTNRVAAYRFGIDFYGYERDPEYFEKSIQLFDYYTRNYRFEF